MDATLFILSFIFGVIGMAMLAYGKRNQHIVCISAGLALMVFPYFIPSAIAVLIVGSLITAAPYYISV